MDERRVRVLIELHSERRCDFRLTAVEMDQPQAPGIEGRHWFLRKLEAVYENTRQAIEEAHEGWLYRIKRLIRYLESKIGPEEDLMKQLRKADIVEIFYPPDVKEKWVRRMFRRFIRRRLYHHLRGLIINSLLLPVMWMLTPIPGPNVFLGWNAFRLISHYLAREGGRRVQRGECHIAFIPDPGLIATNEDQKLLA